MSVGKVKKTGDKEYSLVDFSRQGLSYQDLAEFIGLGHEIEVTDETGHDLTKETLVAIALSTGGDAVTDLESARAKLMKEDEFRLHQLIEDKQLKDYFSK